MKQDELITALRESGDLTENGILATAKPLLNAVEMRSFREWLKEHIDHLRAVVDE